jgi:hypothetical protein
MDGFQKLLMYVLLSIKYEYAEARTNILAGNKKQRETTMALRVNNKDHNRTRCVHANQPSKPSSNQSMKSMFHFMVPQVQEGH